MLTEDLKSMFDKAGITLAVAESASVGHLAALIASEKGASTFFQGGVVAYSLRQKVALLGVNEEHAASCDCVSERVACEMATGVRKLCGTTVGLSVTGYAGSYQNAEGVRVEHPFAWIGVDINGYVFARRFVGCEALWLDENIQRVECQRVYGEDALEMLVDYLSQYAPSLDTPLYEYECLRPIYERLR